MAFSYSAEELRDSRPFKLSGKPDSISMDYELKYRVKITTTGGDRPEDADPFAIITASGLPKVNRSVYYSSVTGLMIPFLVCREKSAKPLDNKRDRWEVTARFKSIDGNPNESDNSPTSPPEALTDLSPTVQPFFRETDRVLYEDYASPDPKPATLPSGEYFSEPLLERVPLLGLKITQYEASTVTHDDLLDRYLRFNSTTYRSKPAYSWIIEDIEPSEVEVQLSGGAVDAWLVTYTLLHNPLTDGWRKALALLDYKTLVDGKFVPNREGDPETALLAKVDSTGAKKADQTAPPDYEVFIQQQSTSYGSFLQV